VSEQPVFSKSAERRVKDKLPVPESCPHCQAKVSLVSNAKVYGGREYGDWPWIYRCEGPNCGAYVGTHPNTNIPLGTLATAEIREARVKAKEQFNVLLQSRQMTRTEAYSWLAGKLNIATAACHFGWFDAQQCATAFKVLTEANEPPVRSAVAVKAFADLRSLLGMKVAQRA